MKRLVLIAALFATGFGPSSEAALSGYYDSIERIGTILGDPKLADILRQQPIGAISNTGTRKDGAAEWTIRTQDCDLKVYLVPVLPDGPGKTSYTLDVPDGQCR
ncbi:hypothetical protein ASE36_06000 [Rhizobium sp. Root274]|uniref:hypothetical protein n=1 Tax=unclassified Rhizobium TaxID=2613769 RepID=UPI0007144717|nr:MULTISPECIES: hypothetical protein [unclassified Rhizobium]KQW31775.1 hypothetical protein ASC71_06005 [Rhizobium sp. Root1240]KRD33315.1 hypothetical protein ASE36_06000 [Rhizobium sp. Root274]